MWGKLKNNFRALCVALLCSSSTLGVSWIVPGAVWTDTSGNKIDAHGGQILKQGNTFYWVGSAYANNEVPNLYSSTDLLNWTFLGPASTAVEFMYRPKLFTSGGKFYIWGQVNRAVQGLVSSTISGGYSVNGAPFFLPPDGRSYSDEGIFVDTTGEAYLLTSADSNNLQINQINGGATVSIGSRVLDLEGSWEAPGMLKSPGGIYYLIMSSKTGYTANANQFWWSTSITGPFTGPAGIAPGSSNTYNSQNSFELKIAGSQATTYIYMGDAWDSDGTAASNYEWLPISINDAAHTVTLQDFAFWKVDVNTGVVTTSTTGKRYDATEGLIMRRGLKDDCRACKRSVPDIDSLSNVTISNIEGTGEAQWVSIHYTVSDPTAGDAYVWVNGDEIRIADKNSRAGWFAVVPISLTLKKGDTNVITFGCKAHEEDSDFVAHLEGIELIDD
ncbi:carbohydrate-binding module family 35 protein [Collybiopsis luxurians FD-317 M1]|uniref:Carbohydrate-binding module family 35 protein n=1 Tax=Collybiopsis luxurians FD-317 M1 TaxID=944289 RepID=A0A0D0C3G0_9AGAR|nr:carbohydrate-binding module family 35 protein [Collybiopsis luxurians FD-317 M1]